MLLLSFIELRYYKSRCKHKVRVSGEVIVIEPNKNSGAIGSGGTKLGNKYSIYIYNAKKRKASEVLDSELLKSYDKHLIYEYSASRVYDDASREITRLNDTINTTPIDSTIQFIICIMKVFSISSIFSISTPTKYKALIHRNESKRFNITLSDKDLYMS